MKKSIVTLIISICFLAGCIIWTILSKNENFNLRKIDDDFIKENYEINLYEDKTDNKLTLIAEAKEIGNYEIIKELEIKLSINCVYTYLKDDEVYTDMNTEEMILKDTDGKITGKMEVEISDKILNSYSCSYNIIEGKGEYK